jgi:hypothetical protein
MSAYYRVTFNAANNEDLRQTFALSDQAGSPISLAGATLRMGIDRLSGDDLLEASTLNGQIVVTDESQGQFEIAIPASVMSTLLEGVYRHDLVMTTTGTQRRIWTGTLAVAQGVTA